MATISVYGYDSDMLAAAYSIDEDYDVGIGNEASTDLDVTHPPERECSICPFLKLPFEVRAEIYRYVIPSTFNKPIFGIVWYRATAPLWATCRQVYNECIGKLYRDCTFDVDVKYDGITFHHQWLNTHGPTYSLGPLICRRIYQFPDRIPIRNRDLMSRLHVTVHQTDGYEGMIKFDYSNPKALALGVRERVQKLCNVLQILPEIRDLRITYAGYSNELQELMPMVLEPFRVLRNTRTVCLWSYPDFIDQQFALSLQRRLENAYTRNSLLNLPPKIRAAVFHHVLPHITNSVTHGIREVQWHHGNTAIMRTCRLIYEETSHLSQGLSEFGSREC